MIYPFFSNSLNPFFIVFSEYSNSFESSEIEYDNGSFDSKAVIRKE